MSRAGAAKVVLCRCPDLSGLQRRVISRRRIGPDDGRRIARPPQSNAIATLILLVATFAPFLERVMDEIGVLISRIAGHLPTDPREQRIGSHLRRSMPILLS